MAENVSKVHLLNITKQIVTDWVKNHPGFIKWEIHSNNDGGFTNIVYWQSQSNAKNAEKEMINIPNYTDWYSYYKEGTITSKNLTTLATF